MKRTVTKTRHSRRRAYSAGGGGWLTSQRTAYRGTRDWQARSTEIQECEPLGRCNWYITCGAQDKWRNVLERVPQTGGHRHEEGPVGRIEPGSGVGPGKCVFYAPDSAGLISITTLFSDGTVDVDFNRVRLLGLEQLKGSASVKLVGQTASHPSNHWGRPALVRALKILADKFYAKFSIPLSVNDMSLEWGGLFDHEAKWSPPHQTHRDGLSADIRVIGMSAAQRVYFQQVASTGGFRVKLETTPPHWHITLGSGSNRLRSSRKC